MRKILNLDSSEDIPTYWNEAFNSQNEWLIYDTVMEFFDSLYTCIEINGCDKATALKLFKNEAANYYFFLYHVIESRSEKNDRHGLGVKCLGNAYALPECRECHVGSAEPRYGIPHHPWVNI